VWPTQINASASPTCRFFSTAFAPKSSHFYTPFPSECALVKTESAWQFESIAFYIALADGNGLCGPGTIPLYRVYDNGMGGAPNHRYSTSFPILNQMIAAGWSFEGNGNTMVFACVPLSPIPPSIAQGWHAVTYPATGGIPVGFLSCGSTLLALGGRAGQYAGLMSTDHAATWQNSPLQGAASELGNASYFWRDLSPFGLGPFQETADCGATWTQWSSRASEQLALCLVAASEPDVVWRGGPSYSVLYGRGTYTNGGGPFPICTSPDNGASWTADPVAPGSVVAVRGGRWFALGFVPGSGSKLLFRSDDQGQTWQSTGLYSASYGLNLIMVTAFASTMGVIGTTQVPGTSGPSTEVLWLWDDAAATWSPAPPFPSAIDPQLVNSLAVNPAAPQQIFLTMFYGGVFESGDRGVTWTDASAGLPGLLDNGYLLFDPSLANRLYLYTSATGNLWALDITQ
jgi:hypothetical protein